MSAEPKKGGNPNKLEWGRKLSIGSSKLIDIIMPKTNLFHNYALNFFNTRNNQQINIIDENQYRS